MDEITVLIQPRFKWTVVLSQTGGTTLLRCIATNRYCSIDGFDDQITDLIYIQKKSDDPKDVDVYMTKRKSSILNHIARLSF